MLLRNGITDVNTERPEVIELAKKELLSLVDAVNVKVSTDDYTNLPEGKAWVHQAWSGSMVSAQYYLPKGVGVEVLEYWFPEDGRGAIGNDTLAVLRSARNPVLAHHFLNFMLDEQNAYDNFVQFVGYQPPLVSIHPDRLVADEVVPPNLKSAVCGRRTSTRATSSSSCRRRGRHCGRTPGPSSRPARSAAEWRVRGSGLLARPALRRRTSGSDPKV